MIESVNPELLDRELYDESLAAQTLGVPQSTLHWWLEGGTRRGRNYEPVLRVSPTGSRTVTWGEFVEALYLREYRRTLGVPLTGLRDFIAFLRSEIGVAYPLAYAHPWVGPQRRLLVKAQQSANLPTDLWPAILEPHSGVTMLLPEAERFLTRVEFDNQDSGYVVRMYPAGKNSPVVIDPELRFGSPNVYGIPTEVLVEQVRAGEQIESIARDFDLELEAVIAALNYENLSRPIAA
jgi:uncharacterized protein (DUF433 family)